MINLSRMRNLIKLEQRLLRKHDRIFASATRATTVLTGMPRASGNHSQVETGAIELAEVEAAYQAVSETLQAMRDELKELLPALDDPDDIGIMILRYINGHYPEEIPAMVNLSRRAMFYHLSGAERKLVKMFPDRVAR